MKIVFTIALKRNFTGKIKYGQQEYDFDEDIMTFMSPGQVRRIELKEAQQEVLLNYSERLEKARHQLATTKLSVGEIAYNLGFGSSAIV